MLPKTAEYALRAAVCVGGGNGGTTPAEDLSEATQIPRRYLHKVLQGLIRAGIVRSQQGPGGGYALAKSPEKVSILEVIDAVAPLERIERCPLGLRSHKTLCPLHQQLDRVYADTQLALSRVTIGQLLNSKKSTPPLCVVS